MTSLSTSASEGRSFDRLHVDVQRWIREQGWSGLREIQDRAIHAILGSDRDVIIMAGTASGKTEAAFLPLLTEAATLGPGGLRILYVSPLKALINDQHRRLDLLCERMGLELTSWHGDAPQAAKARLLRKPNGVALITPESIEALLLRRPGEAARLFSGVQAIIVDELHAFLQGPRGLHLASLLRRLDQLATSRPRRVGLSATLGDADIARRWMNTPRPEDVLVLQVPRGGSGVRLQVRGYEEPPESARIDDLAEDGAQDGLSRIADHLFANLRGSNNLIFAASRRTVEALADRLRQRCEGQNVPGEFFPHHGSLSKELREELELRLKAGALPTTAVATTTLELGIDLGSVRSVAQIGAPRSLAGLKQRLGRSGRRGEPAVMRIYVREERLQPDTDPLDRLRLETVRAVACVRLLQQDWVEPAASDPSLATVVLHQTLSRISAQGGVRPASIHKELFGPDSFLAMKGADFAALLRGAASDGVNLLEQSADGHLMLGEAGEPLVEGRDFYAVFSTDQEWRLVSGDRTLGTIPVANVLGVGSLVGFAGRRWRVEAVDDTSKVLEVVAHRSGKLPRFNRPANEALHDRVAETMRMVLEDDDVPAFLDPRARAFLEEGRSAYASLKCRTSMMISAERDTLIMTWRGTAVNSLLAIVLAAAGLEAEVHDVGVSVVDVMPDELKRVLGGISACPPIADLAVFVENLRSAKFDDYVDENLLRRLWILRNAHLESSVSDLVRSISADQPEIRGSTS